MAAKDLSGEWSYYGAENPYFGVCTIDKFKRDNLSAENLEAFFASGEEYIARIWRDVQESLAPDFAPENAMDFGCGVGRLVIPLAARVNRVVGVDISDGMLAEARRNCEARNAANVSFVKSDENFSENKEKFDFVHSFIVLQHIKPSIGENIFRQLVEKVADGGIGVLQVMYANPMTIKKRLALRIYRDVPFAYRLRNLLAGTQHEPYIRVYTYDLNRLLMILQENDCHRCSVRFSDHGLYGAILLFKKEKETPF